ncbi:MAG: type IV pilus modification protein PilV [Xanthomonadales bacterium]|nr:type IV pilus modification protein PilV [Xanthomonadales bacterium]
MRHAHAAIRSTRSRGFSLIEILIAILVMALGMLGIAALQATSLRNAQSAYESSQGVMLTYSIIEAMRANRSAAIIGNYDLTSYTCAAPAGGGVVENDLRDWITNLQSSLGSSACGRIECNSDECEVRIRWDDSRGTGGSSTPREVITSTLI